MRIANTAAELSQPPRRCEVRTPRSPVRREAHQHGTPRHALRPALLVVAELLALTATACGSGGPPSARGGVLSAVPTSAAPEASTVAATPTAMAGASIVRSSPRACRSPDLRVTLGPRAATAGSVETTLRFRNVGDSSCVLAGHPGVSFVGGDDGRQIGRSALRDGPAVRTLIRRGRTATANLLIVRAQNYEPATCRPLRARGLRVYPPDSRISVFVPTAEDACSRSDISLLRVGPVR